MGSWRSIRHGDYGPSGKEASLRVYVHDPTSAPRMQSNSERMAGCAVAVHNNQLKHTYDSSKFRVWNFEFHIKVAR